MPQLAPLFPKQFRRYHEPFLGGGAVFFYLYSEGRITTQRAFLSDVNDELYHAYQTVRYSVNDLIDTLHQIPNASDCYYTIRSQEPRHLSGVERAARFIYLNKTCFNGLYRVNKAGQFNVPFGRYKNPCICDEVNLLAVHEALRRACVLHSDYQAVVEGVSRDDFVYFDPPYHPLNATSNFTSYTGGGFGEDDQRRLADTFRKLDKRGCHVMLSNSDTPFIRELYAGYRIETVQATRRVNSKADGRGAITEVVVLNY